MSCPHKDVSFAVNNKKTTYCSYLELPSLLASVQKKTEIHDEHLFIITHQTYELWFKQIIFEIDSVRATFLQPIVSEASMLQVNSRLNRVVKIYSILVDQIKILETMTPMDFLNFRSQLSTSSGFESYQFRIIENKLGIKNGNRINYNQVHYASVFDKEILKMVQLSGEEPSLFDLVELWLERTPGKLTDSFNFGREFKLSCETWFKEEEGMVSEETDEETKYKLQKSIEGNKEHFATVLNEDQYNILRSKGERRLSWSAFHGALMIYFYHNEVQFHEPFQMINLLMDIDSHIMQWRSYHVLLVQRQIGTKAGTGGSSGYRYLRATVSDRYKAFLDFFNLSNYLIPRSYIPSRNIKDSKA